VPVPISQTGLTNPIASGGLIVISAYDVLSGLNTLNSTFSANGCNKPVTPSINSALPTSYFSSSEIASMKFLPMRSFK
jgi:hypothetical protein